MATKTCDYFWSPCDKPNNMCNDRCAKKRKHALEEFISGKDDDVTVTWHHVFRYEVGEQANNGFLVEKEQNNENITNIIYVHFFYIENV